MPIGWSYDNTKALIIILGQEDVQQQLDGVQRNRIVCQRSIASELQKVGVGRTWQQCRTKINYITFRYRKVSNKKVADNKYLRLTINLVDL